MTCSTQTTVTPPAMDFDGSWRAASRLGLGKAAGDLVENRSRGRRASALASSSCFMSRSANRPAGDFGAAVQADACQHRFGIRPLARFKDILPPCTAAASTFSKTLMWVKGFGT